MSSSSPPMGATWPFAPAKLPFFYGWAIVGLAVLGAVASLPGQTAGVSVFNEPLQNATGVSRLTLSITYLIGTFTSGSLLPLGGRALERLGCRRTGMLSAFGLGLVLIYMSQIDRVVHTLGWLLPGSTAPLIALISGFAALRFTGQGMLTLVSRTMLVKWFHSRRGLVSGFFSTALSVSFSCAPLVLAWLIESSGGWRQAWLLMAAIIGIGVATMAWLFYRDSPESVGLRVDGKPISGPRAHSLRESNQQELSADEAIRKWIFWACTLPLAAYSCIYTGILFHIVDLGAMSSLSKAKTLSLFMPITCIAVVVGLLVGPFIDRRGLRWSYIIMLLAQSAGYWGIAHLNILSLRWLGIVGLGVASGFMGPLSTVMAAKLFGCKHVGTTNSRIASAMILGSALGPALLAASKSITGSYTASLHFAVFIPVLLTIGVFLARAPTSNQRNW